MVRVKAVKEIDEQGCFRKDQWCEKKKSPIDSFNEVSNFRVLQWKEESRSQKIECSSDCIMKFLNFDFCSGRRKVEAEKQKFLEII